MKKKITLKEFVKFWDKIDIKLYKKYLKAIKK